MHRQWPASLRPLDTASTRRQRHRSSVMDLDNLVTKDTEPVSPLEERFNDHHTEDPREHHPAPPPVAPHFQSCEPPAYYPAHQPQREHEHPYPHQSFAFPHHQPHYHSHYYPQQQPYDYPPAYSYPSHSMPAPPPMHDCYTSHHFHPTHIHPHHHTARSQDLPLSAQPYHYTPLKAKRKRASPAQLSALNAVFEKTFFPSTELRLRLAQQLAMTPRAVQIWFQNKRQTWRLKHKGSKAKDPESESRADIDSQDEPGKNGSRDDEVEEDSDYDFQDQTGNRFAAREKHRQRSKSLVGIAAITPSSPELRADYFSSSSASDSDRRPEKDVPYFRLDGSDEEPMTTTVSSNSINMSSRPARSRTVSVDMDIAAVASSSTLVTCGSPCHPCPTSRRSSYDYSREHENTDNNECRYRRSSYDERSHVPRCASSSVSGPPTTLPSIPDSFKLTLPQGRVGGC